MCGIAGIYNLKDTSVSEDILKRMLGRIRYRGPDECGVFVSRNIGIGNVRLSIIDLSSGQQPMPNDDRSLWIVYNGEVFNYPELRSELERKEIKFRTDSDTEVVLRYYEQYGEDCLNYFNGQFAFSIWDSRKQELFLARDRMGIRPLFYTRQNNTFVFGSEIKSILECPDVNSGIDPAVLHQVFTFWTTLSPKTVFREVFELPPGHYMKVSKKETKVTKYWNLNFPANGYDYISDAEEAAEKLSALFEDAVRIRLRADVPVAAYLSGGIDSSSTTYYIKKADQKNLQTFSIGFADKDFDETLFQNEVSEYLQTQHTGFTCTNQDIAASFPEVVWHTENPVLRTAPVPMYLLSKNVRRNNIKVVITGEGADEMLGGYNIFKEMIIRRFWARYPDSQYRPLLLKQLYPYIPALQNQSGKMLKFFFGYKLTETNSPVYSHLLRWNNSSKITGYLTPEIQSSFNGYDPVGELVASLPADFYSYGSLAKAQWLESTIFMSGYLLSSQGDRMAMANSVEGRYPFLDHRVMEFAGKLHPDLKINGLNEKFILKKMMTGKIPESVLKRSKQAYRAPISGSFLGEQTPSYVQEMLDSSTVNDFGIFDPAKVTALYDKLKKSPGSEIENMALAAIISTQLIQKHFFADKPELTAYMDDCRVIND
ncbi:MAG: asparagine synthase (glutamine-hydrolyzing) [Bacteroidales bacterium]